MKTRWLVVVLTLAFVALVWWSRRPLPERKSASVEIIPAPMNARPLVNSRMSDRLPNEPRRELPEANRLALLKVRFFQAVNKDHPEGRAWESMSDQEFIRAVEDWSNDLAEELASVASSDELADLGFALYPQVDSPYLRFLLFSWAVRFDMARDPEKLLAWLVREPLLMQSSEPESEHEDSEVRVRRLLGNALLEYYGLNLVANMKPATLKQVIEPARTTSAGLRVEALVQKFNNGY